MVKRHTNLAAYNQGRMDGFRAKRSIWACVSQQPGCTEREISDATGLAKTTVDHHVRDLLRTGVLVAARTTGGIRKGRTLRASVPFFNLVAEDRQKQVVDD